MRYPISKVPAVQCSHLGKQLEGLIKHNQYSSQHRLFPTSNVNQKTSLKNSINCKIHSVFVYVAEVLNKAQNQAKTDGYERVSL